jgi:hypothetical protein
MKRLFTILFLLITTVVTAEPISRTLTSVPQPDATVAIEGKLEPIFFEPAAMVVTVKLQSWTKSTSPAWPAGWVYDVRFVVKDEARGESRDVRAEAVRQEDEVVRVDEYAVLHGVMAEFRLPALPQGRYTVSVSYDRLSQSTPNPLRVVRGDETAEIRDWTLQRHLEHAKTWQESKQLELARIDNNPHNAAAWFGLAMLAEQHEDLETTNGYYQKAMSLTREIGDPDADETVRGVQRILELLPAYFADRQHLVIVREHFGPGTPALIELRERKITEPRVAEPRN